MSLTGKRLMVLGAGPFQVPAIRKAVELGCHVITVDYLPDNVGHRYSHEYRNCSTRDKDGVLRVAQDLGIDGICTFSSDVATPTVAYVCEKLGLSGPSPAVAETMAIKHRFRAFLREAHFPHPHFLSGNSIGTIAGDLHRLKVPVIFKPVDTSGSRGITRLDRFDVESVEKAFLKAQSYSHSKTVCVEEFISGTEVGGDAIIIDCRVAFIAITHKHLRGFVVTGHSLPTNIPAEDQSRVLQNIEAVCTALGYRNGALNFDAISSENSVTILEMSPRNGGNGLPEVIDRATGVDVEKAAIRLALGEIPDFPYHVGVKRSAGSFVFGSRAGGKLRRICLPENLRRQVPEVFEVHYVCRPGDAVAPFEHNGNLIGYVLFDCLDAFDYERVTEKISDTLDISVCSE